MIYGIRLRDGKFVRWDRPHKRPNRCDVPTLTSSMDEASEALSQCPSDWWAEIVTFRLSWSNAHGGSER